MIDLSLVGKPTPAATYAYTWKETVLYALGIGAKVARSERGRKQDTELDYLYEGRGPKVYPSFAVVPKFAPMFELLARSGGNLAMVVHGGEKVVVKKPFAPQAKLASTATLRAVYDMKRFAQVLVDTDSRDESGETVCTTTSSILFRGEGGFGGDPPPKEETVSVPKDRGPDFREEEPTTLEQALLYRLSGDLNPLHADPDFAKMAGFAEGPILHGLCTFGFMVRHVARGACGGDASRIGAFEAQFRRPVWPGDTLVTEGWKLDGGKYALRVSTKERGEPVIAGAWATVK
jgi:acyl dehydratase